MLGVSEEILNEAVKHFEKAVSFSQDFLNSSSVWIETIKAYTEITKNLIVKQSAYLKHIKSKVELSNTKLRKVTTLNENEIKNRINKGLEFLNKKLTTDGYWEEYINSAGASSIWATSFIYSFTSNIACIGNFIPLDKLKNFLISKYEKGFGFNDITPRDGDSTNFGLLALHQMGIDVNNKLNIWLKYQRADGGFSTYMEEDRVELRELMNSENENDFGAWENSQTCVSAVALYLMYQLKEKYNLNESAHSLSKYIATGQVNSMWGSYWWTSPLYSSSFIIKTAYEYSDKQLQSICLPTIERIFHMQSSNGCFGDSFLKESSFYTGLVTTSLCSSPDILAKNKAAIEASIKWLINNQFNDGSWLESNAMRLPSFRARNLDEIKSWPISRMGLNVRAVEFNRLFSTAVCISALNSYARLKF